MIAGIGVDIIEIERVSRLLERHPERFLAKVFTPAEVRYCCTSEEHKARRLAARYAAKEAVLKALGTGLREGKWTELEVVRDELGKPMLEISGRFAELARKRGIARFHLSLSHSREFAIAQVVAET